MFSDLVKFAFHLGRKLNVHDLGEVLDQKVGHHHPKWSSMEPAFLLLHISTGLNGLDNRRVSTGTANTFLFQSLDQSGFAEPWRRLRVVLSRIDPGRKQRLRHFKIRQQRIFLP